MSQDVSSTAVAATLERPGMAVDFDRFRLRTFVAQLEAAGQLDRRPGLKMSQIAAAIDGNPKAVLFENLASSPHPLVANVKGSRGRMAMAFGVEPADLVEEIARRLESEAVIVPVPRAQAPVQQVVVTGDDVNMMDLPVHLQHARDGGPYLSAGLDFMVDPETGRRNSGCRRMMMRSRNTSHISIGSDGRKMWEKALELGVRQPTAIVIGSHPIDHFVGALWDKGDELATMARLRNAPMPVVKCVTSDILVPADAEWVIEGYLDREHEPDGPFGEGFGYYGGMSDNARILHVTAITRRHDALFETVSVSGPTMEYTDCSYLSLLSQESVLWRNLKKVIKEPVQVYCTPRSGVLNLRMSIRQHAPDDARKALEAAFTVPLAKTAMVVDDDIDIFDDQQMDWALATRFMPHRDVVIKTGGPPLMWDPARIDENESAQLGLDLTMPRRENRLFDVVPLPPTFPGRRFPSLRDALADGPKYFEELMAAVGSDDAREVMLLLHELRLEGVLNRDRGTGQYFLKAK